MIKIGDKLKVLFVNPLEGNTVAPPLDIEKEYAAQEVYVCKCGQEHIHVGLKSKYAWITCYKCKDPLPHGELIHWCHPTRFQVI